MSIKETIKEQLRSVIQWEQPQEFQIFYKFTDNGDEIKNASKLILQPGQGCIFTHEGKIEAIFDEEGLYDLKTSNTPFLTTMKKVLNAFESEHKVGLWFYRKADINNIRWGTRIPIKYNDPVYAFPVHLRGYGNYSIKIVDVKSFFVNIIAGQNDYFSYELQELFLSRITQPISNYLANAKFSYAEIDSHIEEIALEAQEKTLSVFENLGFKILDFRIEGTSFDEETNQRINEISNVQADVHAAKIAGVDFAQMQQLKALRDLAKNEGTAGASIGMFAGMNMAQNIQPTANQDLKSKLKELKELFDDGLIDEQEFKDAKAKLMGI